MAFEHLHALPSLLPIPKLDGHVIGGRQNKRLGRMNGNGANIVRMRLEGCDLLRSIVVIYSELKVIRTANNPVFACNESTSSHRDVGELECLDNGLQVLSAAAHLL